MKAVVFDIGKVLVDWDPHLAWIDDMGSREAVALFLDRIGFEDLNLRADGGELFADLAQEIDDAEDRARFSTYVARYPLTVPDKITGTWDLLYRLKQRGITTHAITNWSAETWAGGVSVHPELGEVFETLIVSGRENLLKPQAEIFHRFCARAGLAPELCVFVDDKPENIEGARSIGMDGIHFTTPAALEQALTERGLL